MNSSNQATNPYPQSIAVADFNGDGKLDLTVPVYSMFTSLNSGITAGQWRWNIHRGAGETRYPVLMPGPSPAHSDFNGDGNADVTNGVTLPDANEVMVYHWAKEMEPLPRGRERLPDADGRHLCYHGRFPCQRRRCRSGSSKSSWLDFDNHHLSKGDGTFNAVSASGIGRAFLHPAAVGGFNESDGKMDLAVANYSASITDPSTVTILLGNGDGTFTPTANSPVTGDDPLSITSRGVQPGMV